MRCLNIPLWLYRTTLLVLVTSHSVVQAQEGRCTAFERLDDAGVITSSSVIEASGLAFSRAHNDVLWTHNDSGDGPTLYAMDRSGRDLGSWRVIGADAKDWEDVAVGPCADTSRSCLYIADMGNNDRARNDLVIYRVPEPDVDMAGGQSNQVTARAEAFRFRYPDGSLDAESLLVHPQTGDVYIISKRLDGPSVLYHMPMPLDADREVVLERLGGRAFFDVPMMQGLTTGASFAPSGTRFVVRTYLDAFEFQVSDGPQPESVRDAFLVAEVPHTSLLGEAQGEAVTYDPTGTTLWTVSEGPRPALRRVTCLAREDAPLEPVTDTSAGTTGDGVEGCATTTTLRHRGPLGWPVWVVLVGCCGALRAFSRVSSR